jgi:predicted permease
MTDLQFALRVITRRRTFAAIAVGTLALGIGAATAIYSVVDSVLLRPLPFDEPGRIAAVWITQPGLARDPILSWLATATPMGHREYDALRRNSTTLRDVAMWTRRSVTMQTDNGPERLEALRVTSSLLSALRVRPALGRAFMTGEDALGGPRVTMLSWEAWTTRFGSDSGLVGRSVTLNDKPWIVIGVLPPGLRIDRTTEAPPFWMPALQDSSDIAERNNRSYTALARLAPGVTFESASQEAASIIRSVTSDTALNARVEEWQRDQGREARGALLVLVAAVGLLLAIACANVAILQLGEAAARTREMTTRAALGAGSGRLVRQLLVESLVLALVSALLGTALAWVMIRGLIAAAPARLPGIDAVAIDGRVLAFAVVCASFTGLLFGLAPAFVVGRIGTASLVRIGAGQSGRGARRLQLGLIASQLALSMVLLVEASLLTRSLRAVTAVDPGFRPAGLVSLSVAVPFDDDELRTFVHETLARIERLPGVERASAATHVPFADGPSSSPIQIEPLTGDRDSGPRRQAQQRYVMPGYLETLGIRLIAGRMFDASDGVHSEPVAIMSEAEVRRDFGGTNPLGRRVKHQNRWRRVVGVVSDVKYRGLTRESEATIYIPLDQYTAGWPKFVVRGPGAETVVPAIKVILKELEPRAVLLETSSLPKLIQKSYAGERYRTTIIALFGVMASLLAAVGLYGVSVRAAAQRNREIGIRLALGGTSGRVVQLLVSDAMRGVVIGLALGIPAALLAGRFVRPYLFRVNDHDPASYSLVGALLIVVTAVASFLPARRAGRANPAVVLRGE